MSLPAEFKRLFKLPKSYNKHRGQYEDFFHALVGKPTPRQQYIYDRAWARYQRRPDAYVNDGGLLRGEIGTVFGFRIIESDYAEGEHDRTREDQTEGLGTADPA